MIYLSIFAFALALAAAGCAVAGLIISSRHMREVESWRAGNKKIFENWFGAAARELRKLQELQREVSAASPTKLAAEVAALSEAVARLAETHRRFAGRFHATKSRSDELQLGNGAVVDDDELAATLRLQTAPPVRPGG